MGLISALIYGKSQKEATQNHQRYLSIYSTRSLGLVGLVIIVCTFPSLVIGSLYKTSENNGVILFSATLRMWLAVISGVLGAFSSSAITFKRIFIYDLIYGGINVINI